MAQDILRDIVDLQKYSTDVKALLGSLMLRCRKLYELNKEKNISHFAVIDTSGVIVGHNDEALWDTQIESPVLLDHLQRHKQVTVLDETTYHTFVPIFGNKDEYIGSIDVGIPKSAVDEKVKEVLIQLMVLFGLFLFLSLLTVMALQIRQATTQQLTGVRQLLETTDNITSLIDQNLESSQRIAHTTEELSSQADILLHSVDRFKLEAYSPIA